MLLDKAVEALADSEHDRWSKWMRYLFSKSKMEKDGSCVIPSDLVSRWQRQMDTPYSDLSEGEKESDRKEAWRTIEIMGRFVS